jgi:hypothetical protein
MKKLLAGLIVIIMLSGIFGFAPSMAYAADESGGNPITGPLPPPRGN